MQALSEAIPQAIGLESVQLSQLWFGQPSARKTILQFADDVRIEQLKFSALCNCCVLPDLLQAAEFCVGCSKLPGYFTPKLAIHMDGAAKVKHRGLGLNLSTSRRMKVVLRASGY